LQSLRRGQSYVATNLPGVIEHRKGPRQSEAAAGLGAPDLSRGWSGHDAGSAQPTTLGSETSFHGGYRTARLKSGAE